VTQIKAAPATEMLDLGMFADIMRREIKPLGEETMPKCLIVEDVEMTRRLVKIMLAQLGIDSVEVENGEQALAICTESLPDLILVDWHMPVMDGLSFVGALRALPGGTRPKVLMCTSETDTNHINRALANGVDDYLLKPFNREIFADKVHQALKSVARASA
jgi:two-component system chemotaxis response regulator CheY